jgi:hypothetical protein
VGASQPTFVPDLDVPFDLEFRRTLSIDEFAADLAEHLGKDTEGERDWGEDGDVFRVNKSNTRMDNSYSGVEMEC